MYHSDNYSSQQLSSESSRSVPRAPKFQTTSNSHQNKKNRTKIIKKQKKPKRLKKTAQTINSEDNSVISSKESEIKSFSSYADYSFRLFQDLLIPQETNSEKYKRLRRYFQEQVDQYFQMPTDEEEVNIREEYVEKSFHEILNEKIMETISYQEVLECLDYWSLQQEIQQNSFKYVIVANENERSLVLMRGKEVQVRKISTIQQKLLVRKQGFNQKLIKSQKEYRIGRVTQKQNLSIWKKQLIFLVSQLKRINSSLNLTFSTLFQAIHKKPTILLSDSTTTSSILLNKYHQLLIKKSFKNAISWNYLPNILSFFAYQQYLEAYPDEDPTSTLMIPNKKQFKKFIKNKNKKNTNNKVEVLASACIGCFGYNFESSNKLIHCSECFCRFHEKCFQGEEYMNTVDEYEERVQYCCQNCIDRAENCQNSRWKQCQFCGIEGVLSMEVQDKKRIHVFCAIANNLWKFENSRIVFCRPIVSPLLSLHCELCTNKSNFIHFCLNCHKKAHASCAYLAGWQLNINQNGRLVTICCNFSEKQRLSQSRKFILNYKNAAVANRYFSE